MKIADKIYLEVTPCPIDQIRKDEVGDLVIRLHWDYDTLYWRFQIVKVKAVDERGRITSAISTPVIQLSRPATIDGKFDYSKRPDFLSSDKFYELLKEFENANTIQ